MKTIASFFLLALLALSVSCKEAEEFKPTDRELSQQEKDIMDTKWCAEKYVRYDAGRQILTLFKLELQETRIDIRTTTIAPGVIPPIQRANVIMCGFTDTEFLINCPDMGTFTVKMISDRLVFPIMEDVTQFSECTKDQSAKF